MRRVSFGVQAADADHGAGYHVTIISGDVGSEIGRGQRDPVGEGDLVHRLELRVLGVLSGGGTGRGHDAVPPKGRRQFALNQQPVQDRAAVCQTPRGTAFDPTRARREDGSLEPLRRFRERPNARNARDLSPVPSGGILSEIAPVTAILNRLLDRLKAAFSGIVCLSGIKPFGGAPGAFARVLQGRTGTAESCCNEDQAQRFTRRAAGKDGSDPARHRWPRLPRQQRRD